MAEPAHDGAKERKPSAPSVAIAFGGGGARGMAHIHVIETLDELGIRPVAIAGSSIGAVMGAAMASGMSGEAIRDFTLSTIGKRSQVWSRFWRMRPSSMKDVVAGGLKIGQFNVERVLGAFLPEEIPASFDALSIPTQVIATDYYAQCETVCDQGDLHNALACSAAIPAVFRPVRRNGRIMIDGGISNPVPFDHLYGLADIVVGIDVVGAPTGEDTRIPSIMDSMFGATQLMMQSIIALKVRQAGPDILLRPDINQFRVLDFLKAREVLAASEGIRDDLKRALDIAFREHTPDLEGLDAPRPTAGGLVR